MNPKYLFKELNYYKKLGKGHMRRMSIKFLFAKTPASNLVNSGFYNKIYSKAIKNKSNSKPEVLQVETTSFCNAKCIMCPHVNMKRKQKIMDLEDFKKICKRILEKEKMKLIILSGFGEPFIDKTILEKIKWINENYPELKIDLYTNASLLKENLSDEILKLKVHKINFSINGTEQSYKRIMDLDYEDTKKNIEYFLNKKRELNLVYPLTNVSLMVLNENREEIDKVIKFWFNKADSVMAYLPSDWAGNLKSITGINSKPFKDKRWPCRALWTNITVDVDGNIVMCCRDYESSIKFGNVLKDNYEQIKEKMNIIKKKHLEMDYSMPVCNVCDNSFDSSLDWWA